MASALSRSRLLLRFVLALFALIGGLLLGLTSGDSGPGAGAALAALLLVAVFTGLAKTSSA